MSDNSAGSLLEVRGITKDYHLGKTVIHALRGVDFQVARGDFLSMVGPSGCGKTTLLRTIAGFHRQDRGEIWLGDQRIDDLPAYKRDTGMVFQNYAVFPHMTVFENVAYGLQVRRLPRAEIEKRVAAALRTVHLEGYGKRTPDQLSGGQQQRVGLARAMAIEPRVLLFDEPLSNLDAKLRVEMRDEIRTIQKQLGITSVYVTHDQEEALVISDRIAVVSAGRIQQVGPPWSVYKDPANLFVATFVGKANILDAELGESAGPGLRRARAGTLELEVTDPGRPSGTRVTLAFRPEDIVEGGSSGSRNRIEGAVIATSFLGAVASVEMDCGGSRIVVERHRPKPADIPEPGSPVTFALPPEAVLLFDPADGARLGRPSEAPR